MSDENICGGCRGGIAFRSMNVAPIVWILSVEVLNEPVLWV